jgi:hypothetical protein
MWLGGGLEVEWLKSLLGYLAKLDRNLGVKGTDRTGVIVREVFKRCAWLDPAVRFSPLLVIDIRAYRAEPPCRGPLLKAPLSDLAFPLHTAEGTDIRVREIFEGCSRRDFIVWFSPQGGVDIPAYLAFVALD